MLHNARCRALFRSLFLVQYMVFIWVQLFHNLDICNPSSPHATAFLSAITQDDGGSQYHAQPPSRHHAPVKIRLNKRYQPAEAELHAIAPVPTLPTVTQELPTPARDQVFGLRSCKGPEALRGPPALS